MESNMSDGLFGGKPELTEEKKQELLGQNEVLQQEEQELQKQISAEQAGQTPQQQTTSPKGDVQINATKEKGESKGIFNPYINDLLEYNNRREGPILEADERFFFKTVSKIEDNNLSGWDMGVVPLMNKSSKYMLSKQVNAVQNTAFTG